MCFYSINLLNEQLTNTTGNCAFVNNNYRQKGPLNLQKITRMKSKNKKFLKIILSKFDDLMDTIISFQSSEQSL